MSKKCKITRINSQYFLSLFLFSIFLSVYNDKKLDNIGVFNNIFFRKYFVEKFTGKHEKSNIVLLIYYKCRSEVVTYFA